jgi:sugar lactone lactonase YvrE
VDAVRRRLIAVSDAPLDSALFAQEEWGRSALHVFDLRSGKLLWHYMSEPEAGLSLNDVEVLPDGRPVVSAAGAGLLLRFPVDGGVPDTLGAPGSVPGANGLCLAADGRSLYVSAYVTGILRMEIATGAVRAATRSDAFTTVGVDGLYRHDGRLLAIQNYGGLDRVAVFGLDDDGTIATCDVRVARQPSFVDPTTGAVRDGHFYFIADSHVSPFLSRAPGAAPPERTTVCRIPLGPD